MDDFLAQVSGGDLGVVITPPLLRDAAQADGPGGAVLQAAETADAVAAEAGLAVLQPDVALGAELHTLAAAHAGVAGLHFGRLLA